MLAPTIRPGRAKIVGDARKAVAAQTSPTPITRGDNTAKVVITSGRLETIQKRAAPDIITANGVASLITISQSIRPKVFVVALVTIRRNLGNALIDRAGTQRGARTAQTL